LLVTLGLLKVSGNTGVVVSVLAGGLIAIVPQAYFGHRVFRYTGAQLSPEVTQSFYKGEFWKFTLTATGFSLVLALVRPINGLAVFVTFIGMTVMYWIGSWLVTRSRKPG
jgi:ATP synthase protein I